MKFDRNLTLEELEQMVWDNPPVDSYVVSSCHALRKKPLKDFTSENIRIFISQNLSLNYMVPLVLDTLAENVWNGGDMYDGCLLANLLEIEPEFWRENIDLFYELKEVMAILFSQIETFQNRIDPLWKQIENVL